GSAALIGALVVGDSVRESLRERALSRLGGIRLAMSTGDRFFGEELGKRLEVGAPAFAPNPISMATSRKGVALGSPLFTQNSRFGLSLGENSAVLLLRGTASRQDGTARANQINVLGIDIDTWAPLAHWTGTEPEGLAASASQ